MRVSHLHPTDRDDLDGCGALFETPEHDDPLTAHLRPLFPRGTEDANLSEEWLELFGDCGIPDGLG